MRKRNHALNIRLSDGEYAALQSKLKQSGQTQQAFMINAIDESLIATPELSSELAMLNQQFAEQNKQLRGIGTNINQLAHRANGYDELPTVQALERINKSVDKIRKEADPLWQSIRQLISRQSHTGP